MGHIQFLPCGNSVEICEQTGFIHIPFAKKEDNKKETENYQTIPSFCQEFCLKTEG